MKRNQVATIETGPPPVYSRQDPEKVTYETTDYVPLFETPLLKNKAQFGCMLMMLFDGVRLANTLVLQMCFTIGTRGRTAPLFVAIASLTCQLLIFWRQRRAMRLVNTSFVNKVNLAYYIFQWNVLLQLVGGFLESLAIYFMVPYVEIYLLLDELRFCLVVLLLFQGIVSMFVNEYCIAYYELCLRQNYEIIRRTLDVKLDDEEEKRLETHVPGIFCQDPYRARSAEARMAERNRY